MEPIQYSYKYYNPINDLPIKNIDPILISLYETLGYNNITGIYNNWVLYSLRNASKLYKESKDYNVNIYDIGYLKGNGYTILCYDIKYNKYFFRYDKVLSDRIININNRDSPYFEFYEWSLELIIP